jgi:hypothetical protein
MSYEYAICTKDGLIRLRVADVWKTLDHSWCWSGECANTHLMLRLSQKKRVKCTRFRKDDSHLIRNRNVAARQESPNILDCYGSVFSMIVLGIVIACERHSQTLELRSGNCSASGSTLGQDVYACPG